MYWLYLLLAFASVLFALKTTSSGLMVLCMLAALPLLLLFESALLVMRFTEAADARAAAAEEPDNLPVELP